MILVLATIIGVIRVPKPQTANSPIRIGNISALTGVGVAPGEEERNGAQLAIEEINARGGVSVGNGNNRPLELVAEDLSLDKLKDAPLVVSKLVSIDHVSAIVGAQWDEPSEAIIPLIEAAKIPTISGDATNHVEASKKAPYFFSTWYDNRVGIKKILSYAKEHDLKRIYIIRPIDGGFWKYTADLLTEYAPQYGVEIIGDMNLGDALTTDFRTSIAKVKQLKPDAVFIVETDPGQCAFAKQASELGLKVPILATEAAGNYDSLSKCPALLETTYFSTPTHTSGYTVFETNYVKRYGRSPQYPSAVTAYDAVYVIAHALEKTRGVGGEVLRDAIATTRGITGASLSEITLDKKGYLVTPEDAFEMQTVRNGKFVKAE